VIDGAGIGVVVDEIRNQGLPVSAETFTNRYATAFTTKWTLTSDSAGALQLCHNSKPLWSIDCKNGKVQLIATADSSKSELVKLFEGVDFSKPFSVSNSPPVEPDLQAQLVAEAGKIREYYLK
jgi:hypothetical protein